MNTTAHLTSREMQALNTQAIIIDAAEDIFLAQGFAATSLGAIAAAAAVSKALIVHHFGTKDQLWQAVIDHQQTEITQAITAILARCEGADCPLKTLLLGYADHLTAHPQHVRFLLISSLALTPDAQPPLDTTASLLLPWLAAAQAQGRLPAQPDPLTLYAATIGSLRAWFASQAFLPLLTDLDLRPPSDPLAGLINTLCCAYVAA